MGAVADEVWVEVDLVGLADVVPAVGTVTSGELGPGAGGPDVLGAVASEAVGSDEGVELLKAVSLLCQRIRGAGEIQRGVSDVEGIRRRDGAGQVSRSVAVVAIESRREGDDVDD